MDTATVVYLSSLDLLTLVDTTTASTGAITFTSDNVDCSLSGVGNRTLTADSGTGTCNISVTQEQDPTFQSANATAAITLAKKDQVISFTTPTDMTVGASGQNLNVSATSTLTIAMTVNSSGICSVSSLIVSATAQGTCSLTANQAGNNNWNPAPAVTRTFQINPATNNGGGNSGGGNSTPSRQTPSIIWNDPNDIYSPTPLGPVQLNAIGSVPGVLVYSPALGTVLPVGRHTLNVTLNPTDSSRYNSVSTQVQIRVLRERDRTVLTWNNPEPINYPTPLSRVQLNARANNPGTLTYSPPLGTILNPGTHILNVNFTPTLTNRFQPASTQVTILVREVIRPSDTSPVVVSTETPTITGPNNPNNPGGPKVPVITINETTTSVEVTDKGKGVNNAAINDNRIEVKTDPKFSGKTNVEVTYVTPSETKVVVVPVSVAPQAPINPTYTPLTMQRSVVRWSASPNAQRYEVTVRGQQVCVTSALQCRVPQILGPAATVSVEAIGGDNLRTSAPAVYKFERMIIALTVNFDTAKFNLKPAARQELRDVAAIIEREGFQRIEVTGHTDSRSFDNQTLSQQRAQVTVDFLDRILPSVEFEVGAFAANRRVSAEDTPEGLAANRRSELTIVG
jgi:outer membrane protein OmpA-like peptidoglycan-associated protein